MTKTTKRLFIFQCQWLYIKGIAIFLIKQYIKLPALFLTLLMLLSFFNIPLTYAYFGMYKPAVSETLSFQIIEPIGAVSAQITFMEPFLMENEEDIILREKALEEQSMLSMENQNTEEDFIFEGTNRTGIEDSVQSKDGTGDLLYARLELEQGFDVSDIYIPSIKINFNGRAAKALSGELDDDTLILAFDQAEVASWFTGSHVEIVEADFEFTGDGYVEGLYPFSFSGEASLLIRGSYKTVIIKIEGLDELYIPDKKDEIVNSKYQLVNQNGINLEGVIWKLQESYTGVTVESISGELTVKSDVMNGKIVLLAFFEGEGRQLAARKEVILHNLPRFNIDGERKITIPLPEEILTVQYEISFLDIELAINQITWFLKNEPFGVEITDNGLVYVSGESAEGSFTVCVRAQTDKITFYAELDVILEKLAIGVIEISGESNLQIPGEGEISTLYKAAVLDINGLIIQGEPVTWELESANIGVKLSEHGELRIKSGTAGGEIILAARSLRDPIVVGQKSVWLEATADTLSTDEGPNTIDDYPDKTDFTIAVEDLGESGWEEWEEIEEEVPDPGLFSIHIEGPLVLIIPETQEVGEPVEEIYLFSASIRDLDNNILVEETVYWSLEEEIEGVSLNDEKGELTVTSSAKEGSVTLIATSSYDEGFRAHIILELVAPTTPGEDADVEEPLAAEEIVARKEESVAEKIRRRR